MFCVRAILGAQLTVLTDHDFFGEDSILDPDAISTSTCSSLTYVNLMLLERTDFEKVISRLPGMYWLSFAKIPLIPPRSHLPACSRLSAVAMPPRIFLSDELLSRASLVPAKAIRTSARDGSTWPAPTRTRTWAKERASQGVKTWSGDSQALWEASSKVVLATLRNNC